MQNDKQMMLWQYCHKHQHILIGLHAKSGPAISHFLSWSNLCGEPVLLGGDTDNDNDDFDDNRS